MYRFLNFHVLISHGPSVLNRDKHNRHKTAPFGGVTRLRHSSQALKKAWRESDYYQENLGDPSIRTKHLPELANKFCEKFSDYSADDVLNVLRMLLGKGGQSAGDDDADEKEEKISVIPWCLDEVKFLFDMVAQAKKEGLDNKKIEKRLSDSKNSQELKKCLQSSIDLALSGRMSATGILVPVDGALSVAHALTTHAVEPTNDWFVATDDLKDEADARGSAHIGEQDYGSGVFYRYASLNIQLLQDNLGGISRERALEIASHVAQLITSVSPQAKKTTYADFSQAEYICASFSHIPISAQNAFERPVRRNFEAGGMIDPSITAFESYYEDMLDMYEVEEISAAVTKRPSTMKPKFSKLSQLRQWIRTDGGTV